MEQILQSLNLGTLYARFQEQRIEPETLLAASDQELVRLGISTIGDRIRIRDACKKKLEENHTATSQATAVREERRSLFNPRRYNNRTQVRSAARSSSGASKGKSRVYPWSPKFVCLADCTTSKTPTSVEQQILFKAGLGLKKIKLELEDDEETVMNKITSEAKDDSGKTKGFPQLKTCGGFEMMRSMPSCRDLTVIDSSWNARDLQSNLGGGQAKIYLRPIQKSLSIQPLLEQRQSEVKERCHMCNQEILVRKLREHLWSCTAGLDSDDDDGDDDKVNQNLDVIAHSLSGNSNAETTVSSSSVLQSPSAAGLSISATSSATPIEEDSSTSVVDLTESPAEATNDQHALTISEKSIDEIVSDTVTYCQEHDAFNPVEILRCFQQKMVTGRALEVERVDEVSGGETNFIMVDRHNLMETAFDEIMSLGDYRKTLQVQFYGEVSAVCYKASATYL